MLVADLQLPTRLLAGGGPATPDPRVLRALATPLIGQFDPDFTAIMDDVAQLAREVLLTANPRTYAVSGMANAGLEAVLNSVVEPGTRVAILGGPSFVFATARIARRCGLDIAELDSRPRLVVAPFVDPTSGTILPVRELATRAHEAGALLVLDATLGLGACEFRMDDSGVDVCVAGVEYAIGAPPGMTLISYTRDVEAALSSRSLPPPRTSYLDLRQLQAYWSPERLNHHTAPTSLVYGLREALRVLLEEGLEARWRRHASVNEALRHELGSVDVDVAIDGDIPFSIAHLPNRVDEATARTRLLEDYGVYVTPVSPRSWRLGLVGADARKDAVEYVAAALSKVLGT